MTSKTETIHELVGESVESVRNVSKWEFEIEFSDGSEICVSDANWGHSTDSDDLPFK